jgi:succinyl-CoA synthetase alpha subunit
MIYTVIKKNAYQDSISLMLLTNRINTLDGIQSCSIMMGTEANKNIFQSQNLMTPEVEAAAPNDMCIVIEASESGIVDRVLEEVGTFLDDLSVHKESTDVSSVTNWDDAFEKLPDANLALFSTPGEYTAPEIEEALDRGLHVFSFTDNISLDDEIRLKKKAHKKGLLFMGPDCGTGIISGIPLAFTNVVRPGNIGIVGASGTGIQEVTAIIDRMGGGVVHAIGTGGRDLNEKVGAISVKDALIALDHHDPTDVIVVISKPPAKQIRDEVVGLLQKLSKPVVAVFLGENPRYHEGKVYLAHTLEETALMAMDLAAGRPVKSNYCEPVDCGTREILPEEKTVKGLYSGGSLAAEAGMLITEALHLGGLIKEKGYILKTRGYEVVDLGDDVYTQGKPHPMIDPEIRTGKILECAHDPNTGVILLDCMLGYGCHPNMAKALEPAIRKAQEIAGAEGRKLYFVASVCGTDHDPQDYQEEVRILKECGVQVERSNARAVRLALKLKGIDYTDPDRGHTEVKPDSNPLPQPGEKIMELLNTRPRVINVGVASFNDPIRDYRASSVQFSWKPMAGGNKRLIRLLHQLNDRKEIDAENSRVLQKFKDAQPFLIDVVPAGTVIPELNGKTLLHAGPPIEYKDMTGPMQGSCIGAALFEKWGDSEDAVRKQLEEGEINFIPCHHVHAVGPMGGITSGNMPVLVVENKLDGTRAYCTLNEGIGKVLRFGAYSDEVIRRLIWLRDVLGPVLGEAVRSRTDGLNLNVIIARSITMGDEFHQRNFAASLNFLKEIVPDIVKLHRDETEKQQAIRFLADTDQFFLNVMMAAGKSIVDSARRIQEGCVVTTMARNGREFGIRISGMGDTWFTAPVNTPKGLYFAGYSEQDGNPDIGDSSITETVGVGGMSMVAAPGVTRFVGAGGFEDALRISNEMQEICITHNANFTIPTWDFKGTPLGIDIRKVVATGITPVINTGIAHKKAGVGQIGAGTVRAPLACFEKALTAYAAKLELE